MLASEEGAGRVSAVHARPVDLSRSLSLPLAPSVAHLDVCVCAHTHMHTRTQTRSLVLSLALSLARALSIMLDHALSRALSHSFVLCLLARSRSLSRPARTDVQLWTWAPMACLLRAPPTNTHARPPRACTRTGDDRSKALCSADDGKWHHFLRRPKASPHDRLSRGHFRWYLPTEQGESVSERGSGKMCIHAAQHTRATRDDALRSHLDTSCTHAHTTYTCVTYRHTRVSLTHM